ncbi:hypothetical protein ACFSJW_05770 [Flavobacterium artemisiae]|uniref:DUF4190 domain-containing protein n=1 Tax=Flavobacterium artemisiae TaxID=2126556 RepID=A0ABW4HIJ7_9FLAO
MDTKTNSSNAGISWGTASLIFGITALILSFIPCVGFLAVILDTPAIIFAVIGITKAKAENAPTGLLKTALVVSLVASVVIMINIILVFGLYGLLVFWD